jgi:GNAT superfamily N-acetyltransferase
MATIDGPLRGQGAVAERILRALPHWFGIAESNRAYVHDAEVLPTFVARDGGDALGFMTVRRHFPESAELLVLGVLPDRHRHGIGSALLEAAEVWLRAEGVRYLQVKTLGPSDPDEGYRRTRAFYLARGFAPLEEMTTLWDADNPALIMVKHLDPPAPR